MKPTFIYKLDIIVLFAVFFFGIGCAGEELPSGAEVIFIENTEAKLGVDLNRGGAIVFLSRRGGGNLINNFDLGRQVQLSFFSGPVPYGVGDQKPAKNWEHIGWNPIQAGDDFGHASKVLEHRVEAKEIYVKTLPLQWPLNQVSAECTLESWVQLDGPVVSVRARLNNARSDKTQYPARLQELPAVYANAPYHRVVSYTGDRPFTGASTGLMPKSKSAHPWTFWQATEGWSALLDEKDFGLGLLTPGRVFFTGGFAGQPGPNDTRSNSTGYLAGQGEEILDADIAYEFRYELLAGSLREIRDRAVKNRSAGLPNWGFAQDRQGWHHRNVTDAGWPIRGALDLRLDQADPQLISPFVFWKAEEAPLLVLECALRTSERKATVFWQRHGEKAPGAEDRLEFPIQGDGEFHRYEVDLSKAPSYRGGIIRLRIDPVGSGKAGDMMKLNSVRLMERR